MSTGREGPGHRLGAPRPALGCEAAHRRELALGAEGQRLSRGRVTLRDLEVHYAEWYEV